MIENPADDSEQLPYELPYDEQPEGTWMRCPWAGDPEASDGKKGNYAKKCPCPNCRYHVYTDYPDGGYGLLQRLYLWATGGPPEFCRTCRKYSDCTRLEGDCGWRGRVTSIRLTDEGDAELRFGEDGDTEEDR